MSRQKHVRQNIIESMSLHGRGDSVNNRCIYKKIIICNQQPPLTRTALFACSLHSEPCWVRGVTKQTTNSLLLLPLNMKKTPSCL